MDTCVLNYGKMKRLFKNKFRITVLFVLYFSTLHAKTVCRHQNPMPVLSFNNIPAATTVEESKKFLKQRQNRIIDYFTIIICQ